MWSFKFLGILENIGNSSLEIFFKLSGSWLFLEQRLYKFLFVCHLQIIWLLVNRTFYVVLITEGRLEVRNSTLKSIKVSLKLMCTGSKGEIFSRWSSVSSEKKKKNQHHKSKNHFQGVKFQLLSMGIQFTILCPARMEPKFASKDYFILLACSFSRNKKLQSINSYRCLA